MDNICWICGNAAKNADTCEACVKVIDAGFRKGADARMVAREIRDAVAMGFSIAEAQSLSKFYFDSLFPSANH